MRRPWIIGGVVLLGLWGGPAVHPQVLPGPPCPGLQFLGAPNGFERLQVSTTSVSPAGAGGSTPFATAAMAVLQLETSNIRYRDDGGTPTATTGMFVNIAVNPTRVLCAGSLKNLKLIRDTGATTDAAATLTYYGP